MSVSAAWPPVKIAPSILAADFTCLADQVRATEEGKAALLHLDIMDGRFVPNITFGPLVVQAVRRVTRLPLDIHLMIEQPERYLEAFVKAGGTMLNVHVETCPHLHRTLQTIHELGVEAGVAFNPHTPFEMIREVLPMVERVLVMTVNPGFGGQALIPATLDKVRQVRAAADALGKAIEIGVDGGIDEKTIAEARRHGADVFVAGTSVFRQADIPQAIQHLWALANKA